MGYNGIDMMRKAWLVYNPAAGRFRARWLLDKAVRALEDGGWQLSVHETTNGRDLVDLAADAVKQECEAVFVAGGDGSIGKVVSALAGTTTALGVLPSGTANVWAREIGLKRLDFANLRALEKAAIRLARGKIRLVDIGVANGTEFLLWAGIGLDGRIVNSMEPRMRWEKAFGALQYGILALWNSIGWEGIDLRVRSGDQVWEDRFLVAVASNIRSYAGGVIELSPHAKIDDGLLDFWLITGRTLLDAVSTLIQVLKGTHEEAPGVIHFKSQEAVFEATGGIPMHFDGEPFTLQSPVHFESRRKTLRVLLPSDGRQQLFSASESAEVA